MTLLLVAMGAALGAPVRFVVERLLAGAWPWGTFVVNVVGSAVLGALVGVAGTTGAAVALMGIGFCGSLTTFGGYAAQVLDLAVQPGRGAVPRAVRSVGYAAVSVLVCVAAAAAAWALTRSA